MVQSVEERHAEDQVRAHQGAREADVDPPQQSGGRGDSGPDLVGGDPGGFREEELGATNAEQGKNGHSEHDDPHSADPVAQAAPQKDAGRKILDDRENRGSRRREPRHGFEQGSGD